MTNRSGGRRNGRVASASVSLRECLTELTPEQVMLIDRALSDIGDFGQIRIVKKKGRVRYIETLQSQDLLKMDDGDGRVR